MSSSFVSLLAAVLLLLAACGGGESPDSSDGSLVERVVESGAAATADAADAADAADDAEEPASVAVQTPKSVAVQAPRPSWNFVIPDPVPVVLAEKTPPLHRAAFDGDLEAVRELLEQGVFAGSDHFEVDIGQGDWRRPAYSTPLGAAVMNGHMEVVELLLENGAPVDIVHLRDAAANADSPAIVKLLLERFGKPPTEYGVGELLIEAAERNLNPAVVEAFLDYGIDVNYREPDGYNRTALLAAAENNPNPEVIELLLERGANLEARADDGGSSALRNAAEHNPAPAVAALLLERGMRVRAFDLESLAGGWKATALEAAAARDPSEEWGMSRADNDLAAAAIAGLLLDYGANVEGSPESLDSPLAHAVSGHAHRTAQLLLDRGADINFRRDDSYFYPEAPSLLHLAVVSRLTYKEGPTRGGLPLHIPWRGPGALTLAEAGALNEELSIAKIATIQLLLDRGLDVNVRDNDGVTPLQFALSKGQLDSIEILLERGANPILKDRNGNSPCSIAQDSEDDALVMLFEGRCE